MHSQKWDELLEKTSMFIQPAMVSGILKDSHVNDYTALIKQVLIAFSTKQNPFNGLKVFIGGQQSNAHNSLVIDSPPKIDEDLQDWAARVFKGEPFGLIMNFLEDYSNDLIQTAAVEFEPILQKFGQPLGGFSLLFFMGDYGYTPFGVHKGSPGEDGILFHLGPCEKVFYLWDTDEYNSLTNYAPYYKDVEKILFAAQKHVLKPGDCISFPADVFHLAHTPSFSVSMVLDFRKPSKNRLKKVLLEKVELNDLESNLFIDASLKIDKEGLIEDLGFKSDLIWALTKHLNQLKSNGGFSKPSIKINVLSGIISETILTLKKPFQIVQSNVSGSDYLFARGHEFQFNLNESCQNAITILNDFKELELGTSIRDISLLEMIMLLSQTDIFELRNK